MLRKSKKINFRAGRFNINLTTSLSSVLKGVDLLYPHSKISQKELIDFDIQIKPVSGIRHYIKPQVEFVFNSITPFHPLPIDQAFPLLEWGLNWCVSTYCHQFLIIHAAILEKNGSAIVMPGLPGSGKSTLCAALSLRGWRLFSDELTLIDTITGLAYPNPRPVSLKNQSIDIIKSFEKSVVFSETVHDTLKGSVAHMLPNKQSTNFYYEQSSEIKSVIFPKYDRKATNNEVNSISKGSTFLKLTENSFNYDVLGKEGFTTLSKVLDNAKCYEMHYDGCLEKGIELVESTL